MTAALDILTLGILSSAYTGDNVGDTVSCPFITHECQCYNSSDPAIDFDRIECTSVSGSVINFEVSNQTTPEKADFSVNFFSITGNVADLPSDYFENFRNIQWLKLNSSVTKAQNWNEYVFGNSKKCTITKLELHGLDDVFPPPTALTRLGSQGLQDLSINNGQHPVKLLGYQFQELASLRSLAITRVPIVQISDHAFDGLENTLQTLELSNTAGATVEHRSFSGFSKLRSLNSLSLTATDVIDFPPNAFTVFLQLTNLRLGYDNLLASFGAGALNNVPPKLTNLSLIYLRLTEVPKFPAQHGTKIDLTGNLISTLRSGDFDGNVSYSEINLGSNPISGIDKGVVLNADHVDFSSTNLASLDLSLIAYVADSFFGHTLNLTHISVSDVSQVFKSVHLSVNPAVESIDPNVGYVFVRHPQFKIDIGGNDRLNCDGLAWITPYVECSKQVHVEGSTCSNGQKAPAYFQNLGFNCTAMPETTRLLMEQYQVISKVASK